MPRKHDWDKLKIQYVTGDYIDQHQFAEEVGIDYSYLRNRSGKMKWEEAKKQFRAEKAEATKQKTIDKLAELESDKNIQHLEMWDSFANELLSIFSNYTVTIANGNLTIFALERLANIMEKLQKGQRLCLGMDKETKETGEGSLAELTQAIRESSRPPNEVNTNDPMG